MGRTRGTLTLRREDGRIVAEQVVVADTLFRRLWGLLGRGSLEPGSGMVLRPEFSIHTAFMRFPIDAVFLDPEQVVIKIEPNLRPFKTAICRGAREVVELAAGECERRGLELGDRVAWAARASWEGGATAESVLAGAAPGTPERKGSVLLASSDQRFVKLARFLLGGRGIDVVESVSPDRVVEALDDHTVDVVVVDGGQGLGDGLKLAQRARVQQPDAEVIVVDETPSDQAPSGVPVYHKWNETEQLVDAVEHVLETRALSPNPPGTG